MRTNLSTYSRHRSHRPQAAQRSRGFTLIEVMIAALIMVVTLLGVIGTAVKSDEVTADARHRDQARAVLQSFAGQFLRWEIEDPATSAIFAPTTSPTGVGLSWPGGTQTAAGLEIHLGGATDTASPRAVFTREVSNLDEDTGVSNASTSTTSDAGRILRGTFRVTYNILGRQKTETLTIARTTK